MKSSPKSPVNKKWVINSSPVIALGRVGQVELLARLPQKAVIPFAVQEELLDAPETDPVRRAIENGLLSIVESPPAPQEIVAWDLGKGETAVLSYAFSMPNWTAILDDGAARRCARSLSIEMAGTLSVVILAKQKGLIESAAKTLRDLRDCEFRLDDKVIRDALARTVGEKW